MNIDTRINNDFFQHPKTVKLQMELGEIAPMFLIKLWLYASKFFPDGTIRNMDGKTIEKQIGWADNHAGNLMQTLENIGFIERDNDNFILHDWNEHNQWASHESNRKDLNRFNTLSRYFPEIANILRKYEIKAITESQYKAIKAAENPLKTAQKIFKLNRLESPCDSHMQSHCDGNFDCNANDKCPLSKPSSNPNTKSNSNIFFPPPPQNPTQRKTGDEREKSLSDSQPDIEDDPPSLEFVELRDFYDRNARPEGSRSGWIEFKRLKRQTSKGGSGYFPGVQKLMDDIGHRIDNGFWEKGFEPSLARYLNERIWEQEIVTGRKPTKKEHERKTYQELEEERYQKRLERLRQRAKEYDEQKAQEEQTNATGGQK